MVSGTGCHVASKHDGSSSPNQRCASHCLPHSGPRHPPRGCQKVCTDRVLGGVPTSPRHPSRFVGWGASRTPTPPTFFVGLPASLLIVFIVGFLTESYFMGRPEADKKSEGVCVGALGGSPHLHVSGNLLRHRAATE